MDSTWKSKIISLIIWVVALLKRWKGEILVMQPHLINPLIEKFGDEVKDRGVCKTPGTPWFKKFRPDRDSELIDKETKKNYTVQELVCYFILTKYSRADISNIARELSKCMDGATMGSYLEMLRVVKFVLDTKTFCLKLHPKIENK